MDSASEICDMLIKYWLEDCTKDFLQALANWGATSAQAKFDLAYIAGVSDVNVRIDDITDEGTIKKIRVIAEGETVLFIEFGTGIHYPDDHPENDVVNSVGMGRGSFGRHQGLNPDGWYYYGEPGDLGKPVKNGFVHTVGQPASMSMYETKKFLESELTKIAKGYYKI